MKGWISWLRGKVEPKTIAANLPVPPPPGVERRERDEARRYVNATYGAECAMAVLSSISRRAIPEGRARGIWQGTSSDQCGPVAAPTDEEMVADS